MSTGLAPTRNVPGDAMLFARFDSRPSLFIRTLGMALVCFSVVEASQHRPQLSGRGLVVTVLLAICVVATLMWLGRRDAEGPPRPDSVVLAAAGGALLGASPDSAASAFAFVAVVTISLRGGLTRGLQAAALATFALAVTTIVYDDVTLGLLAYALGFAAAALAGSNARQSRERAEQAELLLAQTQRSHEESLRAARLQESTRIAREIHDVLAHALAGLTIQLEATTALIENGAEPEQVLARVRRAHELARDGLRETRRAVGALREGDGPPVPDAIAALAEEGGAQLSMSGDAARLRGDVGRAALRVVQESLTNVAKHAPGAEVWIAIEITPAQLTVRVENRGVGVPVAAGSLADSGGGYGIAGMRERAQALHGTLSAGPSQSGWRVVLRVPLEAGER